MSANTHYIHLSHPFPAAEGEEASTTRTVPMLTQLLSIHMPSAPPERAMLPSPLIMHYSLAEARFLRRIGIYCHDPGLTAAGHDIFTGATMDKVALAIVRTLGTLHPAAPVETVKIHLTGTLDVLHSLQSILNAIPVATVKHVIIHLKLSFAPGTGMNDWHSAQSYFAQPPPPLRSGSQCITLSLAACTRLESASIVTNTSEKALDVSKLLRIVVPDSLPYLQLLSQRSLPNGKRVVDPAVLPDVTLGTQLKELHLHHSCPPNGSVIVGGCRWMQRSPRLKALRQQKQPLWPFPQHFSGTVPYIPVPVDDDAAASRQ